MKNTIDPTLVSVRDLSENEIPFILNYWFHSPPDFLTAMGVDLSKLPQKADMEKALKEKCRSNGALPSSRLNALVVFYEGEPVGFHTLSPFKERESGVFHAHIFKPEFRGRGLGQRSYPMACQIFLDRFELERILFKTPIQNIGAIRVKEKLGIRHIGEETIEFGIIQAGTRAKVFELTREETKKLNL